MLHPLKRGLVSQICRVSSKKTGAFRFYDMQEN